MSPDVGVPNPTLCPYCGKKAVYPRDDVADNQAGGSWVTIQWCVVCERRVTS